MEAGVTPAALLRWKPSDQVPTILVTQEELAGGADGGGMTWIPFSRTALVSTSLGQFLQLPVSPCWKALPSDLLIVKQHYTLITKESQAAKYVIGRDEG